MTTKEKSLLTECSSDCYSVLLAEQHLRDFTCIFTLSNSCDHKQSFSNKTNCNFCIMADNRMWNRTNTNCCHCPFRVKAHRCIFSREILMAQGGQSTKKRLNQTHPVVRRNRIALWGYIFDNQHKRGYNRHTMPYVSKF